MHSAGNGYNALLEPMKAEKKHPHTHTHTHTNVYLQHFNYFGSLITNDARCTHNIKSWIAMKKTAFNNKALSTSKLE
jgi:hypothetical protein